MRGHNWLKDGSVDVQSGSNATNHLWRESGRWNWSIGEICFSPPETEMEEVLFDANGDKNGANGLAYMYYLVCVRCGNTYAVEQMGSM